jgi:hypothetical protein
MHFELVRHGVMTALCVALARAGFAQQTLADSPVVPRGALGDTALKPKHHMLRCKTQSAVERITPAG